MGIPLPAAPEQMQYVKALMAQKDTLEAQVQNLLKGLQEEGVGMDSPLIDLEGYPRSDIDVVAVRTSRHKVICLQNDHKDLMKQIEKALHDLHQVRPVKSDDAQSVSVAPPATISIPGQPFARINAVAPDSPAYEAGLRREDRLIRFGDADASNHDNLSRLFQVVTRCEGQPIETVVKRAENEIVTLMLTPRSGWGGRGTLGCHFMPL